MFIFVKCPWQFKTNICQDFNPGLKGASKGFASSSASSSTFFSSSSRSPNYDEQSPVVMPRHSMSASFRSIPQGDGPHVKVINVSFLRFLFF